MPESELATALEKLLDSQLVFRRGTPPEAVYVFKHALVQDGAYDSLLRRDRQSLHKQIVEVLLATYPLIEQT